MRRISSEEGKKGEGGEKRERKSTIKKQSKLSIKNTLDLKRLEN